MKIKTKLFKALMLIVSLAMTATAVNAQSVSNYTPTRPAIPFTYDMPGLDYPSFNNFYYANCDDGIDGDGDGQVDEFLDINSNGLACIWDHPGPAREHDERKFLIVRNCGQDGSCDDNWFANTISGVQVGDILEFEIYFHNNGDDPYDGGNGADNAVAPYIGLDINDPSNPIGFMFAYNAEYRDIQSNPDTIINFEPGDYTFGLADYQPGIGDPANTISDDAHILGLGSNKLEIQPQIAFHAEYNGQTFYSGIVPDNTAGGDTITYSTPEGDKSFYVASFARTDSLVNFILFDFLPGCYRYSGRIWFRAKVVPGDNECKDVQILRRVPTTFYDTTFNQWRDGYEIEYSHIFDPQAPNTTELIWQTSNSSGHFFINDGGEFRRADRKDEYDLDGDNDPDDDLYSIPINKKVYYAEYGGASSIWTRVNRDTYDGEIPATCADTLHPDLYCNNLNITSTQSVDVEGLPGIKFETDVSWMERTPEGTEYESYEVPSGTQLLWTSGDPNGQFYTTFDGFYIDKDMFPTAGGVSARTGWGGSVYYTGNGPVTVTVDESSYRYEINETEIQGSVLNSCAAQFAIDQNMCTSLTASSVPFENNQFTDGVGNLLEVNGVQFAQQLGYEDDLYYRWELVSGTGKFYVQPSFGLPYVDYGTEPPRVKATDRIVFDGSGTIRVAIEDDRIIESGIDVSNCIRPLEFEVEPNECTALDVEISEIFNPEFAPNQTAYKVNITNIDWLREGIDLSDVRVTWTTDDPNGVFWSDWATGLNIPNWSYYATSPGEDLVDTLATYDTFYVGSGNISVTITGNDNIPESARNPDVCFWEYYIEPNKCESLSINATESHVMKPVEGGADGERQEVRSIKMNVKDLIFSDETIPENVMIKWSSDDPEGEFWFETIAFEGGGGSFFLQFEDKGGYVLSGHYIQNIHFVGEGTISAEAVWTDENGDIVESPIDLSNCVDYVITPVCYDLELNHPGTIYVNTVSTFAGQAFDTVDNEDGISSRKIVYTVDDDYGFFYTEQPEGYTLNPSEMVNEISDTSGMETANSLLEQWIIATEGQIVFQIPPIGLFNYEILYPWQQTFIPPEYYYEPLGFATFAIPENLQANVQNEIAIDTMNIATSIATGNQAEFQSLIGKMDSNYYQDVIMNGLWTIPVEDLLTITDLQIQNPALEGTELSLDQQISIMSQVLNPNATQAVQQSYSTGATNLLIPEIFSTGGQPIEPLEGEVLGDSVYVPAGVNRLGNAPRIIAEAANGTENEATQDPIPAPDGGVTYLEVEPGTTVYFYATQASTTDVIHIYAEGAEDVEDCARHFPIAAPVADCMELLLSIDDQLYSEGYRFEPNQKAKVSATAQYTNDIYVNTITYTANSGIILPTTDSLILNSIYTFGTAEAYRDANLENLNAPNGFYFIYTAQDGEEVTFWAFSEDYTSDYEEQALQVNATGFNNEECSIDVPLELPAVCEYLELNPVAAPFDPKMEELMEITGEFDRHNGEIQVTVEGNGTVKKIPEADEADTYAYGNSVTFTTAEVADSNNILRFEYRPVLLQDGDDGYIANVDQPIEPLGDISITVTAVGSDEPDCIYILSTTDVDELTCIDLDVVRPDEPWIIEDNADTDQQLFEIDVETQPAGMADELYYYWEVEAGEGEWRDTEDEESWTQGILTNMLENYNSETEIYIYATDEEDGDPIDACEYRIAPRSEDEPDIEKVVFREDNVEEADDLLNIGKTTDYVTYAAIFNPGTSVESVKIWESEMEAGGYLEGDKRGRLEFDAMRINIAVEGDGENKGDDSFVLYQDNDYKPDETNSSTLENSYYSDENYNYDDDMDANAYVNRYDCEDGDRRNDTICLYDMSDATSNFKTGDADRALEFRNIHLLREDNPDADIRIIIKYQMSNESKVKDEGYCEGLQVEDGCGEEFPNEIQFEAWSDNDFGDSNDCENSFLKWCEDYEWDECREEDIEKGCEEYYGSEDSSAAQACIEGFNDGDDAENYVKNDICNETIDSNSYDGDDDAKVIVVCPYIMARTGADVFFRDALDVGVDIGQCSEVKGCIGECIEEEEDDEEREVVSTGAGDEDGEVFLERETDYCRFSNKGDSSILPRNVFKNFSSSVCESSASVAEQWKTENITEAINANITKIARFGANLTGRSSIDSIDQLDNWNVENEQSGVFIKDDGPLTISIPTIEAGTDIPAAQTYIVIGHDLIITKDILYPSSGAGLGIPSEIPSAAFIVINGNIQVDSGIKTLSGVFMAVDADGDGLDGQIRSIDDLTTEENLLTVYGSLIGDVYELFIHRQAIGDPTRGEASVSVNFDQRIFLNTPPAIDELIDIAQLRIAQ